ncbi:MAG: DUF2905 domain-containing protein [Bacteroidetes bacterium]|nr:DUF2905 domain-containing protein [Bacteroidota bacterium]MCL5025564.1 DUF2905 domain-containing protein [Chloroflexota bacterium]
MIPIDSVGRLLVAAGLVLAGVGALLLGLGRLPGFGRLPGDIYIQRDNFTFWAPITSMILLSIVLSAILYVIGLLLRR